MQYDKYTWKLKQNCGQAENICFTMKDIHPQTIVVTTKKINLGLMKHIISVTINY